MKKTPPAAGLPELLTRLDKWLARHRKRFAKGLLPGAAPDQLTGLPDDLRTFLAWHNGQSPDVPGAFIESFHLLSAQQIAQVKKELDGQPPPGWGKDWVPFLDDDNDNYVCVDAAGAVRECWHGKKEHPVVAASLTAWVEQFVTALEKDEYTEDPERGDFLKKE